MNKKIFISLFCLIIFQYSCNESSTTEINDEVNYKNFKIVYTTIVNGMSEICTIFSDGSNYKKIAEFTDLCFLPMWSYDGSHIIFLKDNNPNNEIFVIDSSGSNLQKIGDGIDFICSPIDDKMCYTVQIDSSWNGIFEWEIYIMNLDGSNNTKLTDSKYQKYGLTWSPFDSLVSYTMIDNISGSFGNIFKLNVINKSNEVLVEGYDSPLITDWSGFDNSLLFSADHADIYRLDYNLKVITQLTQNTMGRNEKAKLSPLGNRILFVSNRNQNYDIYTMNTDGSNQMNISNSIDHDYFAQWSPDGTLIAYLSYSNTGSTKIRLMGQNGNGNKILNESEGIDTGFDWH